MPSFLPPHFDMQATQPQTRTPLKFGTDGWRAVIADAFTFSNVERIAQAYAGLIKERHFPGRVLIGYDNRFLADAFARRVASVLSANSIDVSLFQSAIPTPLLSFAVLETKADGGIMITASHNPAEYCGFKIKESWGGSAFEDTTRAIEDLVDQSNVLLDQSPVIGSPPPELEKGYTDFLNKLVDFDAIRKSDVTVVVDSMHGTGADRIEQILKGQRCQVRSIRADRDAFFGGIAPEPIDKNLGPLKETVRQCSAWVGVATDGDADRLGVVDELGATMTMHSVAPLLLLHLFRNKRLTGSVVATVTQSRLMKRIASACGLPYIETPVGFKYIAREMLGGDVLIGAEESGGLSTKGYLPERDGIFNGLLFIELLTLSGKTPSQLVKELHDEFGASFYDRVDEHVDIDAGKKFLDQLAAAPPDQVLGSRVMNVNSIDGVKLSLHDDSWIMFRQSGTEPVMRVYSESPSSQRTAALLAWGAEKLQFA